ncbi:zinc finger protein 639-like isoform X2 [Arctopsyche grandis]|uniref:zinc finger protein 639-like isoform X2 n=1 Tax=Arctopsyche grandis TaxID=121162 RepID=UPI00406D7F40
MSKVSERTCSLISNDKKTPCRLCLRRQSRSIDASQDRLRLILHTLFSFWVNSEDKFKLICVECLNTVLTFYSFYKNVQIIQKEFSDTNIDKINTNIANDDISDGETKPFNEVKVEVVSVDFENDDDTIDSEIPIESVTLKEEYMSSSDEIDDCEHVQKPTIPNSDNDQYDSQSSLPDSNEMELLKCETKNSTLESSFVSNSKDPDYKFPTEIVRNGKLFLKGPTLDTSINKFYDLGCEICKYKVQFTELNELFNHYKLEHTTRGYVTCCNSKLFNKRSISMHMARHLQPSAFECRICKMSVTRLETLKQHVQTHFPHSEKLFQCDQCDKGFGSMDSLKKHKLGHVPISERDTYTCKICGRSFTLSTSYSVHLSTAHGDVKYLCSECGSSFLTKTRYSLHMQQHDPPDKHKVKCSYCGVTCKNKPSLAQHMKRHTNLVQCSLCDYSTSLTKFLSVHMRMKHSDLKPFVCLVCGKSFKVKQCLNTHMAQHTGERKYACSYCPRTFASSGNFYTHRKRMHAEEISRD